jgi:hypothetical protein
MLEQWCSLVISIPTNQQSNELTYKKKNNQQTI